MASLSIFEPQKHRRIGRSRPERVRAAKLYYLTRGRNAWHSTWVTHYQEASIASDLASVKAVAEKWRARGSTFAVYELPSLVIEGAGGALAISQINTPAPLSGLLKPFGQSEMDDELVISSRFAGALSLNLKSVFETTSDGYGCWHRFSGRLRDLLVFAVSNDIEIEALGKPKSRLRRWDSRAQGSEHYLAWQEGWASNYKATAVRRAAEAFANIVQR